MTKAGLIHAMVCSSFLMAFAGLVKAQDATAGGKDFDSSGVELMAWFPPSDWPIDSPGNDVWGYTSPSGRRYAIMGMHQGTGFVEVTDPANSTIVDFIPGGGSPTWRDMKTYLHYCYVVKDFDSLQLQIIDLSDIDNGNITLVNTTDLASGFERAHNIAINEESGFAYLIGSNLGGGGIAAVDLADPVNPVLAGNWGNATGHDAFIISYDDGPFAGSEIAYLFAYSSGMIVLDVTDKSNIVQLDQLIYPNTSICHQGWISENRQYMFIGDEGDENPAPTTTYVADVSNPADVQYLTSFTNGLPSTDHNLMVRGDYVYEANYSSGLRIWDVSDVANGNFTEVGHFDSYPEHNNPGFSGAWAPYVGFPGSIVLLNDRNRGMFVLDAAGALGKQPSTAARPDPDPYVDSDCGEVVCNDDNDCQGESYCVPQANGGFPGSCYVPRNRYLGIQASAANAGSATARRVTVETSGGDVVLGWVGSPEEAEISGPECAGLGSAQLLSRVSNLPHYASWGTLGSDVVHLADCHIAPGYTYKVQAITFGDDIADEGNYSTALVLRSAPQWTDVTDGGTPATPPNGVANLVDVQAVVGGFQNLQTAPKSWLDLVNSEGGVPDFRVINFSDVFGAVQGFQGASYPYDDPCTCAGLPACPR